VFKHGLTKTATLLSLSILGLISLRAEARLPEETKVLFGIDVLEREEFAPLRDKRIGLVTNNAAQDRQGRRTLDVLKEAPDVHLIAIFSPEHGLSATLEAGAAVKMSTDSQSGLPVYSLYGDTQRPTRESLKNLDALVFDMQDVGTRFYTYATTLAYCLEEASKAGLEFIVLDRPNPINGLAVEGQMLEPDIKGFTAYLDIPVRHGMTLGEIARFHNDTAGLGAKLTVINAEGWQRHLWWDQTGLKFNPPSPNIRTPLTALLYCGIGCFEATNVSAGRGTDTPFEVFGAPWMNSKEVVKRLKAAHLLGVQFKTANFTPQNDRYAGQRCRGVQVIVLDRDLIHPIDIFVHTVMILAKLHPQEFQPRWPEVAMVTGSRELERAVSRGEGPDSILKLYLHSARVFEDNRKRFLLYEE